MSKTTQADGDRVRISTRISAKADEAVRIKALASRKPIEVVISRMLEWAGKTMPAKLLAGEK